MTRAFEIVGRNQVDHTVWVDIDGDRFGLSPREIAEMSREAVDSEVAKRGGHDFDWADIQFLAHEACHGADLEPCQWCREPAPFDTGDGWACVGHMDGIGLRESEATA